MKTNAYPARSALLAIAVPLVALVALGAVGQETDDGFTGTNTVVTEGPDITVWRIWQDRDYGPPAGDPNKRGYSVGTDSCNIGSQTAQWCDHSDRQDCNSVGGVPITDHPVISQGLYRLRQDGKFQQIGKSWMKHGFNSLNDSVSACRGNDGTGTPVACVNTSSGPTLNVGCTDFYGPTTNAADPMSSRSEIDSAASGLFADTYTRPDFVARSSTDIDGLIQVETSDIDPNNLDNTNAKFWVEVQYLSRDDATYGDGRNGLNNASYIEATFDSSFEMTLADYTTTVREAAAIWAWKAQDPDVEIRRVDLDTTPVERFHVARRVTASARGTEPWHYEVVVHNLNSDSSASALEITFPDGTTFSGTGFHDVDSHSGEVYDSMDWSVTTNPTNGTIRWELQDGHLAPSEQVNANAIRWGNSYSFWFDASAPPSASNWEIELFEPPPSHSTTITVPFGLFFSDGFESGDTTAWN